MMISVAPSRAKLLRRAAAWRSPFATWQCYLLDVQLYYHFIPIHYNVTVELLETRNARQMQQFS